MKNRVYESLTTVFSVLVVSTERSPHNFPKT